MDRLDIKRVQIQDACEESHASGGQQLLVGQVMTPSPRCISTETTVLELVKLFHAKQFRHLLVTDESGKLRGIVSDRDVIRCFGPSKYPKPELLEKIRTERVMSGDIITVSPQTPLERAVVTMLEHGVSCLPVVVEDKLVGILTNTDLQVTLLELLRTLPTRQTIES